MASNRSISRMPMPKVAPPFPPVSSHQHPTRNGKHRQKYPRQIAWPQLICPATEPHLDLYGKKIRFYLHHAVEFTP